MTRFRILTGVVLALSGAFSPVAADPVMEMRPISASGPHAVAGNQITLDAPGQRVVLDIFLSNWVVPMAGFQAVLDSSGFSSGTLGQLVPGFEACTDDTQCAAAFGELALCGYPFHPGECTPAFQTFSRSDWILTGVVGIPATDLGTDNYRWAGVVIGGGVADPGQPRYAGSLVLDVPVGTIGTFTIGFLPEPASNMQDTSTLPISPITFIPATILVACNLDGDCNDGSACTNDSCQPNGACLNQLNFNPATFCCDPADGTTTLISDGNQCTTDTCDPATGIVSFEIRVGEACGSQTQTACDDPDTCDASGVCQDNFQPPGESCGDPANTDCTAPDTCDGAGTCVANDDPVDTPCGDGSTTPCTNPDACDGQGACLDNHVPDGTPCDDAFCFLNQSCEAGVCAGGTPNLCNDGFPCTTDTCNESLDACENVLFADACIIDGTCRTQGELNPENDCQDCNPGLATDAWSFLPSGAPCDDGDPCTGTGRPEIGIDTCDGAGLCSGLPDVDCNDNCEFAVEVFEGANTGANVNQGPDDVEASCQIDSNNDVWFFHTASCDGTLFASTTGSLFTPSNDPVLSVHDACPSVLGSTELACDDDSGVGLQAALSFATQAGVTYWFRVAGFEDNAGDVVLNLSTFGDCLIDDVCYLDGEINPDNDCQACVPEVSTTAWSPLPEGSACGDPQDTECDSPDACDGAGVCEANPKPDGTACSDEGNECTFDECQSGLCTHPPVSAGVACGDGSDSQCDHPDTCDGAGGCLDNFEPHGTPCGNPDSDQCDDPDICDGLGACDDNFVADGAPCDDADICTGPDVCQVGACVGPFIPTAPLVDGFGARYVRVIPQPAGSAAPVALRVTSSRWGCLDKYVRADGRLVPTPLARLPEQWGTVFIHGTAITPDTEYTVQAECGGILTPGASGTTPIWGDTTQFFDGSAWLPPDGENNIEDIIAIIQGFAHAITAPPIPRIDMEGCDPDGQIDIVDVLAGVEGFNGTLFDCPPPCP